MVMRRFFVIPFLSLCLFFSSCSTDESRLLDEFKQVNVNSWTWNQGYKFSFTVTDSTWFYDLDCNLRITGSYSYSNIWLVYQLDGPQLSAKNQFEIVLSDNTGKWLGKGQSNLLSYEQTFAKGLKLKPGTYTLEFFQNMRDEQLKAVSDIGLRVRRSGKVY